MDAAGGGGPVIPAPPIQPIPGGSPVPVAVVEDAHEVMVEDGGEESGWTDLGTMDLLETALRLLQYALPFGEERLNRQAFWGDVSRSVQFSFSRY